MSQPTVFADASPLIGLARIGRLDLLRLLSDTVCVTRQVWQEVAGGDERPGTPAILQAERRGLITIVDDGDPTEYPQLDAGEASTLSAARRAGGGEAVGVLLDDDKARRLLRRDPNLALLAPHHISTIGLLLLAKRRGVITTVQPLLDDLRRQTFRISMELYMAALRAAGEWPSE